MREVSCSALCCQVLRGSRRSSKSKTETSGASEAYENMCNEHSVRRSSSTYSLKVKASGRESYYYQQTVTTQMTKSQSESCMPSTSVVKPSALKSAGLLHVVSIVSINNLLIYNIMFQCLPGISQ